MDCTGPFTKNTTSLLGTASEKPNRLLGHSKSQSSRRYRDRKTRSVPSDSVVDPTGMTDGKIELARAERNIAAKAATSAIYLSLRSDDDYSASSRRARSLLLWRKPLKVCEN